MNSHHRGKGSFGPLPRGRNGHRTARSADAQRRRLIESMVRLAGERGYAQSSVTALIANAGVSRKTFYERVYSRHDLLLAAFDTVAPPALEGARDALESPRPLQRIAEELCRQAPRARGTLALSAVEIAAVNPSGMHRRDRHMSDYGEVIASALAKQRGRRVPPPAICQAIAGSLHRTVLAHARAGEARGDLAEQLARWARSYHPLPLPLARVAQAPGPSAEDLLGGRAPGTLTFARSPYQPPIEPESRGSAVHAQRERILDAVAQLNSQVGYMRMSLPAIAQHAELSEHEFRRHFRGKNEAFAVALEIGHLKALAVVRRARARALDWSSGVHTGTRALLAFLASEPFFARMAFVDAPLASVKMSRRAHEYVCLYTRLLLGDAPRRRRPPAVAPEAAIYALFELTFQYAVQKRLNELLTLEPEASYLVLAPFIGPLQAATIALQ